MFSIRQEIRAEAQEKYGHYCSYTRNKGKEPLSYTDFAHWYLKGLSVKEIFIETNK